MIPFIPTIYLDDTGNLVLTIILLSLFGLMIVSAFSMIIVHMPFLNELIHSICAGTIIVLSFWIYGEITWAEWWKFFLIRYFALTLWIIFTVVEVKEERWDFEKEKIVEVNVPADFVTKELISLLAAGIFIFIFDGLIPLITDGRMFARFTFLGFFGIFCGAGSFFFVGRSIKEFIERRKKK